MKIVVCYIAVTNGPQTYDLAARFVGSWLACSPGADCELTVCCNGGPLPTETAMLFMPLDAKFYPRQNDSSWDIGGYQEVAAHSDAAMLVCMGESCYFWKPGWLERIVSAWKHFG